MSSPNNVPAKGFWKGLARVLHLPHSPTPVSKDVAPVAPSVNSDPRPLVTPPAPVVRAAPAPVPVPRPVAVAKPAPEPKKAATKATVSPPPVLWKEDPPVPNKAGDMPIVTDYDRIFELVKRRQTMKLDEIARVLALKEEMVAQELQTLEDNGLVDVKYPAFGEPLIVYRKPEA